eukprot:7730589-Heterocapsa_arctica.AAC.1
MEEDEQEDVLPADWRRQRTEDSFILANQNIFPTTNMETMIKVEELMTIEERREICQESRRVEYYRFVRSRCGQ